MVGEWKRYLTAEMGSKLDQITEESFVVRDCIWHDADTCIYLTSTGLAFLILVPFQTTLCVYVFSVFYPMFSYVKLYKLLGIECFNFFFPVMYSSMQKC